MAVGRFARAQALALKLIAKNGEESTLRRPVDGDPVDPAKPWEPSAPTNTDTTVDAAWFDHDVMRSFGALFVVGDHVVLIPATSLDSDPDPSRDVLIRADDSHWTIVGLKRLQPNEDKVLYTCLCRGIA